MNKWLFTLSILLLATVIKPQVTEDWVARYNGPGDLDDITTDLAVDSEGNTYVTGRSFGGSTNWDYATIKYDSAGVEKWVQRYNGTANGFDDATSIIIDNEDNVYVTGNIFGGGTRNDYATIKYNSDGVQEWVKIYNSPGNGDDVAKSIAVDSDGNIYVTGYSFGNVSIDDYDYTTIKYSPTGVEEWVQTYNGNGLDNSYDEAVAIVCDSVGNVYVTGVSYRDNNGYEYATIKYNSAGIEQWVQRYHDLNHSSSNPSSIAVDNQGNLYVTGSLNILTYSYLGETLYDYATVKYNAAGVEQWVQKYNGTAGNFSNDVATSLVVDTDGNVYVTGSSEGETISDYATVKYNADGVEQWVQRYNGIGNGEDKANSIAIDNSGNIYVTGVSYENGTANNYATVKYNSAGIEQWVKIYDGTGSNDDYSTAVKVDNLGNVYVTGFSVGMPITSGYDYATIKYSQTPLLKITKPTPFSKFISGETDTVKWVDAGWNAVNIKCKTNFETPLESEIIIAQGIPFVDPEFVWEIPDSLFSFRSKIIIENADNITEKIESDIFRIKPYVLTRLNADSTYYEYRKNRDQWGFSNDKLQMWPEIYNAQFNYRGTDPFTELNLSYSQIQGDGAFANSFGYYFPDWVSWVNTYTINACYNSTFLGLYRTSALLRWVANSDIWEGSCFGIAIANALAFSNKEQFQTKYPNFPEFDNPISVTANDEVRKVISELFSYQFGNPHKTIRSEVGLNKLPTQTLNELKEMLRQDNAEIRTLSFLNNGPKGGGHAVLAYGLKRDATIDGLYYVQIYDNSNLNSNIPIQISTISNGGNGAWGTAEPSWAGWGGNQWLYLRNPTEQYLINPILSRSTSQQSPFILDQDALEINSTISASIQIQDNNGNQTGFINDLIRLDIPGSAPFVIDNGSEIPPYGYSLPRNNYSIIINAFAEDTLETFFFTGNKSFVYGRSGATPNQTDRLFFDGGLSAANPDEQTKTIKLLNLINETTQEKLTVVRSLELVQNDSIKIENPDSNTVKLISYGSAKDYDIELNYVTDNGFGRFGDFNIPISTNSSHTFVPNWTELTNSELQVLVDIGNDGTIDDTLYLSNQVTGTADDQGSLLTPNSYNLAQNYPNPFNPVTTIQYSIPQHSNVTLKVYDILGNEVAALVNEEKESGVFTAYFDASELASGIYLYKLQAGSFVETKKMILLK